MAKKVFALTKKSFVGLISFVSRHCDVRESSANIGISVESQMHPKYQDGNKIPVTCFNMMHKKQ